MKTLILLDRFYRYGKQIDDKYEKYLSKTLIQLIKERIIDYDIDIEYYGLHSSENRPSIAIAGKDEKFIRNLIKKDFGCIYNFSDISVGQIIRGRMRNPDLVNFGIFLDCGIDNPVKDVRDVKDVLLPVFALRNQLLNGKKAPKKKICTAFGFHEEMPIKVKITKIDNKNHKIECELAKETINLFNSWEEDGFELLFATGLPRKKIKKAIKKTKHYPDYLTIERLGFLEIVVFLKKGTHAPGILAEIGPLLNAKFSMFRPMKIRHLKQNF